MRTSKSTKRALNSLKISHLNPQKEKFSPTFPQKMPKSLLSLYFFVTSMGEAPPLAQVNHLCLQHTEPLCEHAFRMFPWLASVKRYHRTHLFFGDHIISEDADVTDLDLDGVARDHVAVSSLGAHPEHIARVEGGVSAQLLNPGRRIPDLIG